MLNLDFAALLNELEQSTLQNDECPVLWGGRFPASEANLSAFLLGWGLAARRMPWRIWEWVSELALEEAGSDVPANLALLERGRLFGPGGDLELRRDEECVLWRFVGPPASAAPQCLHWEHEHKPEALKEMRRGGQEPFPAADFWRAHPECRPLLKRQRYALLWGQEEQHGDPPRGMGVWREDRVAGASAPLRYPGMSERSKVGRVELAYSEYLWADAVQAVWWEGLQPHQAKEETR